MRQRWSAPIEDGPLELVDASRRPEDGARGLEGTRRPEQTSIVAYNLLPLCPPLTQKVKPISL
ncbi:hypothetical protein DFA_01960 [Cavenderia fasciculata]|uniref:Uncharacterized protein n=1 Tax=Cavenderia fasciculata TaxID=261658 RepID=F4PR13_CACFS|nr:uncharacterized protein DFA_01960 [Cavenderia fasciculata]EGG22070.1 hypothetical protein DFA_01960 [Cavenderia fasciculata]|eukprot:XP_004359921.1 hypothetical protein DFA_01960 [Cavenderia fasciculata]